MLKNSCIRGKNNLKNDALGKSVKEQKKEAQQSHASSQNIEIKKQIPSIIFIFKQQQILYKDVFQANEMPKQYPILEFLLLINPVQNLYRHHHVRYKFYYF